MIRPQIQALLRQAAAGDQKAFKTLERMEMEKAQVAEDDQLESPSEGVRPEIQELMDRARGGDKEAFATLQSYAGKEEEEEEEPEEEDKRGWGETAVGIAKSAAKGAVGLAEIPFYPIRKGIEMATGEEIPSFTTAIDEIGGHRYGDPRGPWGRAAHAFVEGVSGGGVGGALGKQLGKYFMKKGSGKTAKVAEFALGNPKNAKDLVKLSGIGGGTSAFSQGTEDITGIPRALVDASLLTGGLGYMAHKKWGIGSSGHSWGEKGVADRLRNRITPEEMPQVLERLENPGTHPIPGYSPSTAEVAESTGLNQLHRSEVGTNPGLAQHHQEGTRAIQKHLRSTADTTASPKDFERAIAEHVPVDPEIPQPYGHTPDDVGQGLREGHRHNEEALRNARKQVTDPLYEEFNKSPVYIEDATNLLKKTQELKKGQSGQFLDALNNIEATILEKMSGRSMSVQDLDSLKRSFSAELGQINRSKDLNKNTYKRFYSSMLDEINPMIDAHLPESGQIYRDKYREMSEPLNQLMESPSGRKVFDFVSNTWSRQDKVPDAKLPEIFFKGTESRANAQDLLKVLKAQPDNQLRQEVQEYIHDSLLKAVVDHKGNINSRALHTWSKNNPGAALLHPEISDMYSTLKKAAMEQTKNKNIHKTAKGEVLKEVLGPQMRGAKDSDKIVKGLFEGDNRGEKLSEVVKMVGNDKRAMDGLRSGVTDDLVKNATLAGSDAPDVRSLSWAAFDKFMTKNAEGLKHVYNDDQMKILNDVWSTLRKRNNVVSSGRASGSNTTSDARLALDAAKGSAFKTLLKYILFIPDTAIKGSAKAYRAIMDGRVQNILTKALTNPQYAHKLITTKARQVKMGNRTRSTGAALQDIIVDLSRKDEYDGRPVNKSRKSYRDFSYDDSLVPHK